MQFNLYTDYNLKNHNLFWKNVMKNFMNSHFRWCHKSSYNRHNLSQFRWLNWHVPSDWYLPHDNEITRSERCVWSSYWATIFKARSGPMIVRDPVISRTLFSEQSDPIIDLTRNGNKIARSNHIDRSRDGKSENWLYQIILRQCYHRTLTPNIWLCNLKSFKRS